MSTPQRTEMTVPATDVCVGDLHIPLDGTDLPVGTGARWLRVVGVALVNGSVLIGWNSSYRWYLTGDAVRVKRVQPVA